MLSAFAPAGLSLEHDHSLRATFFENEAEMVEMAGRLAMESGRSGTCSTIVSDWILRPAIASRL